MILIDTNILLYAVNSNDVRSDKARKTLETIINGGGRWALSWTVIYEFMRVATHPRVFASPISAKTAWSFISDILRQPGGIILSETLHHQETLDQCMREAPRIKGNQLHDFHLAVLMREHGVKKILTEDQDFLMFPWVESLHLTSN